MDLATTTILFGILLVLAVFKIYVNSNEFNKEYGKTFWGRDLTKLWWFNLSLGGSIMAMLFSHGIDGFRSVLALFLGLFLIGLGSMQIYRKYLKQ